MKRKIELTGLFYALAVVFLLVSVGCNTGQISPPSSGSGGNSKPVPAEETPVWVLPGGTIITVASDTVTIHDGGTRTTGHAVKTDGGWTFTINESAVNVPVLPDGRINIGEEAAAKFHAAGISSVTAGIVTKASEEGKIDKMTGFSVALERSADDTVKEYYDAERRIWFYNKEVTFNSSTSVSSDTKTVLSRVNGTDAGDGNSIVVNVPDCRQIVTVSVTDGGKTTTIVRKIYIDTKAPDFTRVVNSGDTFDLWTKTTAPYIDSLPPTAPWGDDGDGSGVSKAQDDSSLEEGTEKYWADGAKMKIEGLPPSPGQYYRCYVISDNVGNATVEYHAVTVVDTQGKNPITVTLTAADGKFVSGTYWYNEADGASVTVSAVVAGGEDGQAFSKNWSGNSGLGALGSGDSVTLELPAEGIYEITLTASQGTGENINTGVQKIAVGMDKTPPSITGAAVTSFTAQGRISDAADAFADSLTVTDTGSGFDPGTVQGRWKDGTPQTTGVYDRIVTAADGVGNRTADFIYAVTINGSNKVSDELYMTGSAAVPAARGPVPSEAQLEWYKMGQYAFIHWGPNAFGTGKIGNGEWGNGYPYGADAFRPTRSASVMTSEWITDVVSAGMTGIMFVAKHHDGFCLWDTQTTEYSVCKSGGSGDTAYSYYNEDILKALVENMAAYNEQHPDKKLRLGIYVSPWDRSNWAYMHQEYLDVFRTQLTEVIQWVDRYGRGQVELFELWLDGANESGGWYGGKTYEEHKADGAGVQITTGPDGRTASYSQTYAYAANIKNRQQIVNRQRPSDYGEKMKAIGKEVTEGTNIVVFGNNTGDGRGIRWIGNEQGWAGRTNWAFGSGVSGSETADKFFPGEADMKTQNGWFFTHGEGETTTQGKTAPKMIEFWYRSVGRNATLLLNFSPNTSGQIPRGNVQNAQTMWNTVSADLADNRAKTASRVTASSIRGNDRTFSPYNVIDGDFDTYWATENAGSKGAYITLMFDEAVTFDRVVLQEYIALGQRVKKFKLEYKNGPDSAWRVLTYPNMPAAISGDSNNPDETTTIGYKRILRSHQVTATEVRITFENYRKDEDMPVLISEIGLYKSPAH